MLGALAALPVLAAPPKPKPAPPPKRLILAHYMPWFQAKPYSPAWGWHWTMNHYDPDRTVHGGHQEIASHYTPLIGPYDSGDPDTLRCQVLLMKLSGIDGVIIDWYGNDDFLDYGINNKSTLALLPVLQQAGLKFAICYEDQTVPKEISGGVFRKEDAVAHGQKLMEWMQAHFFSSPAYVKQGGRPVLLSFGKPYYSDAEWNEIFSVLPQKPLYFTESRVQAPTAAVGGFDWPAPHGGTDAALAESAAFYGRFQSSPLFIPAAFPRFDDIYAAAGVGPSYGQIDDRDGRTYAETLTRALQSAAPLIQIVTWNDWGEGTQIEPSAEHGFRDLEATQNLHRRYLNPAFAPTPADLRLPIAWYKLCRQNAGNPTVRARLEKFFPLIAAGKTAQARALLVSCGAKP